jgi:endonuclease III-like uncharacterized protein
MYKLQQYEAIKALDALCDKNNLKLENIIEMPIENLITAIESLNLLPTKAWSLPRFAAMVKSMAFIELGRH